MSNGVNEKSVLQFSMTPQTSPESSAPLSSAKPDNSSRLAAATLPMRPYYRDGRNQATEYVTYQATNGVSNDTNIQHTGHNEKSLVEAYLLAATPFGFLGAHHFYLQRYHWGFLYFFTGALLGFGYIIDLFRLPCLVKQANEKIKNPRKDDKTISDAYTLWFPFGLLGFHHYYLGNYACGIIYTCTAGIFGIGWIVDAFRMPSLVRSSNERCLTNIDSKNPCVAIGLALSPFGVLGAHHYYLNRPAWGCVYTITGGLGGIGWFVDLFRLPVLIKRANQIILGNLDGNLKTVDDAYTLWFPFGILGFHHFYLQRPLWGYMYFFTGGLAGIGWLIDMCRIPSLVKETNMKIEAAKEHSRLLASSGRQINSSSVYVSSFSATNAQDEPNYNPQQPLFNYHQAAYGYPPFFQENEISAVLIEDQYAPPAYSYSIGVPQGHLPVIDIPPPPYQPPEPICAGHLADEFPEEVEHFVETKLG